MTDVVVIFTTVPAGEQGQAIAQRLVDEHLAACVNLLPPMTSIYRWRGAVEHESEQQLLIKTTRERISAVQARLTTLHPYEVPEFIVLAVVDGSPSYLEWVRTETGTGN